MSVIIEVRSNNVQNFELHEYDILEVMNKKVILIVRYEYFLIPDCTLPVTFITEITWD